MMIIIIFIITKQSFFSHSFPYNILPLCIPFSLLWISQQEFLSQNKIVSLASNPDLEGQVPQSNGGQWLRAGRPRDRSLSPDRLWSPPSLLYNGYRVLCPEIKRQGREANHSPRTSADVKQTWIYTVTPPYVFTA
jgi:hypothetical protein